MGEVYAAVDETLQRRVALKSIRSEHRLDSASKSRFLREARILSQLDHPNICRAYDYITEGGQDWLVLELIDGRDLRQAIRAGLDPASRLRISEQIAAVLVATHAAGVVHRDLKPTNVMITATGDIKVLDFGLAHSSGSPVHLDAVPRGSDVTVDSGDAAVTRVQTAGGSRHASSPLVDPAGGFLTDLGAVTGTLAYMSPEQAQGDSATTASDMYSFGLMLQELFTDASPYDPTLDGAELLARVRRAETRPVAGIDRDLAALIVRLKSLAPSQRSTAVEAAERIRQVREKPARRIKQMLAGAVVAAIALGAIKYTVDLARERTAAVAARADADARRRQAETLIGFMLGDLRTKLQQVGRLELLEDVGREAMTYFRSVPADQLSAEEVYRRSQALYQVGQIHQAKGNLSPAVEAYRDSLALIQQLAQKEPSNSRWQLGLATAHFYVGDAQRIQGDLDGALAHFQEYLRIGEQLHALDPGKAEWTLEASFGHSNVAAVLELRGDLVASLAELEQTLTLKQQAAAASPDNVEWQRAIASTHNRIGVVLHKMGELARAREHYEEDLRIEETLLRRQPGNARLELAVSVAHSWVAALLDDMGDVTASEVHHRARYAITGRLVDRDSANAEWQREHAAARLWIGDLQRYRGDRAAALPLYQQSIATLTALLDKSPNSVPLRRDVGRARLRLARLYLAGGRAADGAGELRAAVEALAPVLSKNARDRDALRVSVDCELLLGAAIAAEGRAGEAASHWQRALEAIEPVARPSDDPAYLQLWARALGRAGRGTEAAALVDRLTARGYRNPDFVSDWRQKG